MHPHRIASEARVSIEPTAISDVFIVRQPTHGDDRGFFRQTYVLDELEQALGRSVRFVQGNHARSQPGVLRGFHAEPWDKLVYVSSGTVLAVIADIRPDSPTFGEHVSVMLGDGADDRVRLFVGEGLGNSYCVVGDGPADYLYDVTDVWTPGVDKRAVRYDDPTLAVVWPIDDPTLSDDDRDAPTLAERFPDHPRFAGDRNAS
jgi:dTDP-4-dehydrorhamnose 3,5-epimerase